MTLHLAVALNGDSFAAQGWDAAEIRNLVRRGPDAAGPKRNSAAAGAYNEFGRR